MLHPLEGAPKTAENIRILIADDEASLRSLLALKLRDSVGGVEVLEAIDGAEAVQLGLQQYPRIALLDVSMPRLGGIEAALALRSLRPAMEIALQSGDAGEHRVRAADLGCRSSTNATSSSRWHGSRLARTLIALENASPPDEDRTSRGERAVLAL